MKYILILLTVLIVGCLPSKELADELTSVEEVCYDGVVYISNGTGFSNLSVKFNPDSTVITCNQNKGFYDE